MKRIATLLHLLMAAGCCQSSVEPSTKSHPPTPSTRPSAAVQSDFPLDGVGAANRHDVRPGFDSPEAVNAYLEQQYPLAKIRANCTPDSLATGEKQDLVMETPVIWKGRLFEGRETGFDKISWYGNVRDGRLVSCSLHAYLGNRCWLVGGASSPAVDKPAE